jgi:hypothetical protein
MASTDVPKYDRVNFDDLRNKVNTQVKANFDDSWTYEAQKRPDLNQVRHNYPTQVRADLDLGGQLRSDTQDQVVNAALHGASNAGIVDSNAGRGLVAKDIGLTSETLRQQRMDRAGNLIQTEPQDFIGLTPGQLGSVYVDDRVRDFQNKKDKAQARQADLQNNIALTTAASQVAAQWATAAASAI